MSYETLIKTDVREILWRKIGRHIAVITQAALKLREISRIHAEAAQGSEL
jgi:glucosamine 6-phosphate synthetase-like amidotransferase/phosphosugar isomerase protein